MVGKVVPLVADRADPHERRVVDNSVRIESGSTCLAPKRRVGERWDVGVRPERRDRERDWDHDLASLDFGAWPGIPRHPYAVNSLGIGLRHLRHC